MRLVTWSIWLLLKNYNLRSASGLILKYPSLKLKKALGDRAFSSAAPNLWNNLPLHIRLCNIFSVFLNLYFYF